MTKRYIRTARPDTSRRGAPACRWRGRSARWHPARRWRARRQAARAPHGSGTRPGRRPPCPRRRRTDPASPPPSAPARGHARASARPTPASSESRSEVRTAGCLAS